MNKNENNYQEMKQRTEITNLAQYLPAETDYAFATQISDFPGLENETIARVVVLKDYQIFHSQKRIILDAQLLHINTSTGENMTNKYNSKIQDWVVTNQFYVMLRDDNGNMLPNPEYIPEEDRQPDQIYNFQQRQKYKLAQAFDYFAVGFKNNSSSNQAFFATIILIGDEINGLFDVYGSLTNLLMQLPPEVNLNPEFNNLVERNLEIINEVQETSKTSKK